MFTAIFSSTSYNRFRHLPHSNKMTQPNKLLDRTFHAAITLKGIGALMEIIGGVLLWFIKPAAMSNLLQLLFLQELARDPDSFLSTHVLRQSTKLAHLDPTFASAYLLSHGITKLLLVICLWMNKLWAYPLTIAVFAGFCVYQVHRYMHTHAISLILLTLFDIFLIYLTWREYLEQKQIRLQNEKVSLAQPE
ncbi:MAG: DUF2127 domain-containing protein [Candidatus Acidiferrales bacterium]